MSSTPARIPSIPVLHKVPDKHLAVEATDNCLTPLIFKGDIAVIDAALSWPTPGEFYAIRRDGKDELWLTDDAAACLPGDFSKDVWLLTFNDPPVRWAGPCRRPQLDVIGRVVGLLDKERPVGIEGDQAAVHYDEYQWLLPRSAALDLARWDLERRSPELKSDNISKMPEDPEGDALFNCDLRTAPLAARMAIVSHEICHAPSNTPEGALAKLQMVWIDVHQGGDPSDHKYDDCIGIQTAIEALGGAAFYMKWNEEAVRERYGKQAA